MRLLRGTLAAIACLGLPIPAIAGQASAIDDVSTYCRKLVESDQAMAHRAGRVPAEIADLISDGKDLCDQGQWRRGIIRLRRAYVLLRAEADEQ